MPEIIIPDDYLPLFNGQTSAASRKRYVIITGGRGSTKSFSCGTIQLVTLRDYERERILALRWTMTSTEISIIPEFTEKLEILGWEDEFKINRRDIKHMGTKSDILFRGIKTGAGNQTANLKSIPNVTKVFIEEAEEIVDESIFNKIDLSVRSVKAQLKIVFILNPTTREHWMYERWFENTHRIEYFDGVPVQMSTHPDVHHIHMTYLDNLDNLDPLLVEQIQELREREMAAGNLETGRYAREIIGSWRDKAEGVIFENWEEGEMDESLPYMYGLDFGFFPDPSALIEVAINTKKKLLYLREGFYRTGMSAEDLIVGVKARIRHPNDLVACDHDKRLIVALQDAGINAEMAIKKFIKDDIIEIQDYKLIVDPDSHKLKKELNLYAWNDKKASVPIDEFNHLLDPMRYSYRRLTVGGGGVEV